MPYSCITTISPPAHYSLYVDCNRSDFYTEQGNILFPYKTLQAALNRAQTLLDVLGIGFEDDVVSVDIIVAAGHYHEDATFTFPTPSRRISIVGKGGFTETRIKSLTITPCLDVQGGTLPNIITLCNLEIGSFDHVATAPALKFVGLSGGRLTDLNVHNCRIISKATDVPVVEAGDPSGDCQEVHARFDLGCEVRRRFSSATSTAALTFHKGNLHLDGAIIRVDTGPGVQISNDVTIQALNSAFDCRADDYNALECSGTSIALLSNCVFETLGSGHSVIHTGTYPGSGLEALVAANMCLFLRETGDAINAAAGALVIIGPAFDSVNLEAGPQITVADPSLLKRLQAASLTAYAPATSGDWVSVPAEVKEALDELASRVKALEP